MEEARKKIRVCLICVVALAVIVGVVYYVHDVKGKQVMTEGTLVERMQDSGGEELGNGCRS